MSDDLDALLAARAAQAPASVPNDLDTMLSNRAAGKPVVVASTPSLQPKANPVGRVDKFTMGLMDPWNGAAQLLSHVLPTGVTDSINEANNWLADKTGLVAKLPERNTSSLITGQKSGMDGFIAQREADYQAKRAAAGEDGFDGWRTAGNFAAGLALPSMGGASTVARIGAGAVNGAAGGALTPVQGGDFWNGKLIQVGGGAAVGGALPILASGAARIVSPKASTDPAVRLLRKEGVSPTLGQTLGGRWNDLEEKLQSVPLLGDMISNQRARALREFNQAAVNRATTPIGATVDEIGQPGVSSAGDAISAAYEAAKSKLGHFKVDAQGSAELTNLAQMVKSLPAQEQKTFNQAMNLLRGEISKNGSITADGFKRIDSYLSQEAGHFKGSTNAYERKTGDALMELQRVITEAAKRANPEAANAMSKADEAWANLVRVEGAAKAAKNHDGVFTPAQLNAAVQQADTSARKRAVSRGEALLQDLANAGQNVLGNKVPNSGTTDRALTASGGALIGAKAGVLNPYLAASLLGGVGAYTTPAQKALSWAAASRPEGAQALADALRKASPRLGPLGGQVVGQLGFN